MKIFEIYMITHIPSGMRYVGMSYDARGRMRMHASLLRQNKHGNAKMQRTFDPFREIDFKMEILQRIKCCNEADSRRHEAKLIGQIKPEFNQRHNKSYTAAMRRWEMPVISDARFMEIVGMNRKQWAAKTGMSQAKFRKLEKFIGSKK